MIGLDSNILVRLLTEDDAPQAAAVEAMFDRDPDEVFVINPVVLAELAWVLKTGYRFERHEIGAALDRVTRVDRFHIVDRSAVVSAVVRYLDDESRADFPDYLIQALNASAGAETTMTFDRKAAVEFGFRHIG